MQREQTIRPRPPRTRRARKCRRRASVARTTASTSWAGKAAKSDAGLLGTPFAGLPMTAERFGRQRKA